MKGVAMFLLLTFFFLSLAMAATTENQPTKNIAAGSDVNKGMEEIGIRGQEKAEWPELIGMSGLFAAHRIWLDVPAVNVEIIPFRGSHPPQAPFYDSHRVRVYVDFAGIVVRVPKIG